MRLFPTAREATATEVAQRFEEDRQRLIAWLKKENLWKSANDWEKAVLETEAGQLSPPDGAQVHLQRESLLALLFALGLMQDLPPFDREARLQPEILKMLPAVGKPAAAFIAGARLRPREEIERGKATSEFWFLRARTQEKLEAGDFPQGPELEAMARELREEMEAAGMEAAPIKDGAALLQETIRFSAQWAFKEGLIGEPIDGDFPVNRRAYRDLNRKELARLRALSAERLRAFRWLDEDPSDSHWDKRLEEE